RRVLFRSETDSPQPNRDESGEQPAKAKNDVAAESFLMQCSGCHTIGGGQMKGPDLITSTQWGEAELWPAVKRMEKHVGPISDDQVDLLVDFLRAPDVQQRLAAETSRAEAEMAAKLDPPDPDIGEALFFGPTPLRNGGMSCVGCHTAQGVGGLMGPPLDDLG